MAMMKLWSARPQILVPHRCHLPALFHSTTDASEDFLEIVVSTRWTRERHLHIVRNMKTDGQHRSNLAATALS
jgi:hypothetical protein